MSQIDSHAVMYKRKKHITIVLLLATILTVASTLVPHHHHYGGVICVEQDITSPQDCQEHHLPHHHPESDTCCGDQCATRYQSPSPSQATHLPPIYPTDLLFTCHIADYVFLLMEQAIKRHVILCEIFQSTDYSRTFSLRAPPYSIVG